MVTYNLTPLISTKFFNFNKFGNSLELDLFLANLVSLTCKCNNYSFVDRHHKYIGTWYLQIIKNDILGKLFIKRPKYRRFDL